jgi:hypothetical protein
VSNYQLRVRAYNKWWGSHEIEWRSGSAARTWTSGAVEVRVNPELFLTVDGEAWVIKLHFNKERLGADRIDTMLRLLELAYRGGKSPTGAPRVAVFDLGNSKMHEPTASLAVLDPVLAGEAASFAAIWNSL